jgi:NAD(P)H-hydrate epimerase
MPDKSSMEVIYQNKLLYPEILWERPVHHYNSKAGRILVIAGSRGTQGMALLVCETIFRCGTGILTLAFPEELRTSYVGILPPEMTLALPQTHSGSLARAAKEQIAEQFRAVDLVLIGPGLSTNTETVQLIWELLPLLNKPLVIDGDGLKALGYGIDAIRSKDGIEKVREYFANLKTKIIICAQTNNISQIMEALGEEKPKCKADYINKHQGEIAEIICKKLGVTLILKGSETIIFGGKKLIINKLPDYNGNIFNKEILSGIVSSFVAQNPTKPLEASAVAVYLDALAEKKAIAEAGTRPLVAHDIVRNLPQAIKESESQ